MPLHILNCQRPQRRRRQSVMWSKNEKNKNSMKSESKQKKIIKKTEKRKVEWCALIMNVAYYSVHKILIAVGEFFHSFCCFVFRSHFSVVTVWCLSRVCLVYWKLFAFLLLLVCGATCAKHSQMAVAQFRLQFPVKLLIEKLYANWKCCDGVNRFVGRHTKLFHPRHSASSRSPLAYNFNFSFIRFCKQQLATATEWI